MSSTLTPEVENRILDWIDNERYPDAVSVVQKALEALEEQERTRLLKLRELVLAGLEGGEGDVLTPELWERLDQQADEDEREGLPIRDEVRP